MAELLVLVSVGKDDIVEMNVTLYRTQSLSSIKTYGFLVNAR